MAPARVAAYPERVEATRHAYGAHPDQWVRVHRPVGASRGTVAVLHGGFWKAAYDASLAEPLSADLAARGWTAVTVEYRRVGAGGGFPHTLDDVAAALDLLPGVGVDTGTLVALGHSAGGHLAAWAAGRTRFERWSGGVVPTHVVAQAGVLDLAAADAEGLGAGAVGGFLGAEADRVSYELADPSRHLPLGVPLWALHARDDEDVPFAQSTAYVERARAAGDLAVLVEVTGGHFGLVTPGAGAWSAVVEVLGGIAPQP